MVDSFKQRLDESENKDDIINEWVEQQITQEYKRELKRKLEVKHREEKQALEQKYLAYFNELNDINLVYRDLFEKLANNDFDDVENKLNEVSRK